MIKFIKDKIKRFRFTYNTLMRINLGQLRITKKGKVKKNV